MTARKYLLVFALAGTIASCVSSVSGQDLAKEYYNLGNAYFAIKRYKDAIEFYQKSLDYDAGAAKASFNMANSYIALGNPDKALEILQALLAKDPRNTELHVLSAYAQHVKGKDDDAVANYLNVLEIQPEDRDTLFNLGVIYRAKKEYDKAEGYLRKLLKVSVDDPKALFALGSLLLEEGKAEDATGFINQYLEVKPEDTAAYLVLANAYSALKQYLKALDSYEKAIALDKTLKDAWFYRADILLNKAQDPDKGATSLEQALDLGFNNMTAITALVQGVVAGPLHDDEKNRVYVLLKKKNLMPNVDTTGKK
jgi:tetratricopeptide (TPR) repeat protein